MFAKRYESDVSIGECVLFMIFDSVFFMLLAWYLEKVVPDQWGKSMPASFIFTSEFWFPGAHADRRKGMAEEATALRNVQADIMEKKKTIGERVKASMVPKNVDGSVAKQKVIGLDCKNLRKVYGTDPEEVAMVEVETVYYCGDIICRSESLVKSRLEMKEMVESTRFEAGVYFFIALNVMCIVLDNERFHKSDPDFLLFLDVSNYGFCAIFTLEVIYKLFGLNTKNYFSDAFNCFDFLLVIASYIEIILVGGGASSAANGASSAAKSAKSVRGVRIARMAKIGKMVRVLRIARLLRWFSYDETKSSATIALANLNLVAYRDEIMSLLGQNGAVSRPKVEGFPQ